MTAGPDPAEVEANVQRQLQAIDAWQRHAEIVSAAAQRAIQSRESRMDAQRRLDALKRAQQALMARSELVKQRSWDVLDQTTTTTARALLVHRNEWMRTKLSGQLTQYGLLVLGQAEDGADGLGMVIAEQPEVIFVEDRLPSITALELVTEVVQYSPGTLCTVQVENVDEISALLDVGARAVFTRRIPPRDVAQEIARLVRDRPSDPLVLR